MFALIVLCPSLSLAFDPCGSAGLACGLLDDGAGYVRWKEGEGEGPEVIHAEAL